MSSELLLLGTQRDSVTYAWGTGTSGRLDNNENFYNFVQSPSLIGDKNFSSVYCNSSGFIGLSGTALWIWGSFPIDLTNTGYSSGSSPVQIPGSWTSFSFGYNHILAIKSGGTLWAWGSNASGQLGTGDTISRSSPVQVAGTWLAVAAGSYFSIALRSDGTVWTFGADDTFQLGQGATVSARRSSPVQIAGGGTYTNVFAGPSTGFAIRSDTTLYGWGENNAYPLQQFLLATSVPLYVNTQSAPVQISSSTGWQKVNCNGYSVLALKSNKLFAWGTNSYGQLGTGDYTNYSSPVQIGTNDWIDVVVNTTSFGISASNELYGWGNTSVTPALGVNIYPGPTSPILVNNSLSWSKVTGGSLYTSTAAGTYFACTTDPVVNNLYGWGQIIQTASVGNSYALLYDKPIERRSSPVQITSQKSLFKKFFTNRGTNQYINTQYFSHVMALANNRAVYGWGWNGNGQLGDGTANPRSSPVLVSSAAHESLALGAEWTLFLRSNGTLWASGDNSNGQLGIKSVVSKSSPVQIGAHTWISIAAGYNASFGVDSINYLYCWGYNNFGEFGTGASTNTRVSSPVLVGADYASVFAGPNTSYAIKLDGTLWSSGTNSNYLLGQGTFVSLTTIIYQIAGTYAHPWVKVAPCATHVLALNSAGEVYAWGTNSAGQFGTNNAGSGTPTPVFVTSGVNDIAVGKSVSFFVKSGILYGCGSNYSGELGLNGGNQYYSSPVQIGSLSGCVSIAPSSDGVAILAIATPS